MLFYLNVMGGCPASSGVIKAAGVRRVSRSGLALAGHCPPGHQKRAVEDKPGQNSDKTFHCPTPAPRRRRFFGLKNLFYGN